MTDEKELAAAPEQDVIDDDELDTSSEMEEQEPGDDQEDSEAEDESGEEGGEETEEGFEEIVVDGQTYKVPSAIKTAVMLKADYTRKTQELANTRRGFEAQQEAINQLRAATQTEIEAQGALSAIDARLQRYSDVDWNRFESDDPIGAGQEFRKYQQLRDARSELVKNIDAAKIQRSEMERSATANRLRQTREYAEKNIDGWSDALDAKVTQFATNELGFGVEELTRAYNPQVYRTLYLAFLGAQTAEKQATAKSAIKPKSSNIKPLQKITSKSAGAGKKSLADMDMEEYAATRKQQMRRAQTSR